MWRSKFSGAYNWLLSRRIVGTDRWGNTYYIQSAKGRPDRRIVDFRDGTPATEKMPVQWWAWLHGRREHPPTPDELACSMKAQAELARRVKALKAEDAKERLRGLDQSKTARDQTPFERKRAALLQLSTSRDVSLSDRPAQSDVDATYNASHNTSEDPKGVGDDFQPGSWVPPTR